MLVALHFTSQLHSAAPGMALVAHGLFIAYSAQLLHPSGHWAHGVVVSHPLSMREALGSIPSVSISGDSTSLVVHTHHCSHPPRLLSQLSLDAGLHSFGSYCLGL